MRSGNSVSAARLFRRDLTRTEQLLWERLRGRRLAGLKFRRQHPIGSLILDFYCPHARLCVEVDGAVHESIHGIERDRQRDEALAALGIRVLRVRADDVEHNIEGVMRRIEAAIK